MNLENITTILECPKCHSLIESKYTHDFKECKCGECFIDGGRAYLRYGWANDLPILYDLDLITGVLTKCIIER
jgi:hypothetical protein